MGRFLDASGGKGRKLGALFRTVAVNSFYQPDGTHREHILRIGLAEKILPRDVRHQTQVVLDELGARLSISFAQPPQTVCFLRSGELTGERAAGGYAQYYVIQLPKCSQKNVEYIHDITPLLKNENN